MNVTLLYPDGRVMVPANSGGREAKRSTSNSDKPGVNIAGGGIPDDRLESLPYS